MMLSARLLPVVASGRQYGDSRREKGGTGTRSPDRGGGGDESDWMQKARKLANKRASQFRRERGAQPVFATRTVTSSYTPSMKAQPFS